ncbi:hypothetical protein ILYODFUR_034569 [Ilyodon furcidens]|uniref:Uncharacterized protein n=1 Tax=Ilyodon furcidens TaxID=33524 RepID=A0ABV0UXW6_9TELE
MTHGPPLGFRDWVPKELQRVGCVELLNTVQKRVRPKLHAFGGIHEGTAEWEILLCSGELKRTPIRNDVEETTIMNNMADFRVSKSLSFHNLTFWSLKSI